MSRERQRLLECPMRRVGSCGAIDVAFGWQHGMPLDECDQCWALGGPATSPAHDWRVDYFRKVLGNLKANLGAADTSVAITVMGRHLEPDERPGAMRTVAARLGEDRALRVAADLGIPKEVVTETFARMSPEEQVEAMPPADRWKAAAPYFRAAHEEVERWSLVDKIVNFTQAIASGRGAPREAINDRHISCHGTDLEGRTVAAPCPSRRKSAEGWHYCADCGCGERKIARLDGPGAETKLAFVALKCPRRRRGFINAAPATERP